MSKTVLLLLAALLLSCIDEDASRIEIVCYHPNGQELYRNPDVAEAFQESGAWYILERGQSRSERVIISGTCLRRVFARERAR